MTSDPRAEAMAVLTRVKLDHKATALARNLSLPEKKRLEIARALATRPHKNSWRLAGADDIGIEGDLRDEALVRIAD